MDIWWSDLACVTCLRAASPRALQSCTFSAGECTLQWLQCARNQMNCIHMTMSMHIARPCLPCLSFQQFLLLFRAARMTIKVHPTKPTFSKWYSSLRCQMCLEELHQLNKAKAKRKGTALFFTECVLELCKTPAIAVLRQDQMKRKAHVGFRLDKPLWNNRPKVIEQRPSAVLVIRACD